VNVKKRGASSWPPSLLSSPPCEFRRGGGDNALGFALSSNFGADPRPEFVTGRASQGERSSSKVSVVFPKAREVGRTMPSVVGLGRFVASFIKLGAATIIAPLWHGEDTITDEIATLFYWESRTTPGQTVSEIFKNVRAKGYDLPWDGTHTWPTVSMATPVRNLRAARARSIPTVPEG